MQPSGSWRGVPPRGSAACKARDKHILCRSAPAFLVSFTGGELIDEKIRTSAWVECDNSNDIYVLLRQEPRLAISGRMSFNSFRAV